MKEGDLLELIEQFGNKSKGYQGICLRYDENHWGGEGDKAGLKVSGMENEGDMGWIMAKRFRVVQSAINDVTEGWTL